MKNIKHLWIVLFTAVLLCAGCGTFPIEFTRINDNTTVEFNGAKAGEEAESNWFTVGKNRHVRIESKLEKGSVEIEFVEVDVITDSEHSDDIFPNEVMASVTIAPGEQITLDLAADDYILRLHLSEDTQGTIEVRCEKNE